MPTPSWVRLPGWRTTLRAGGSTAGTFTSSLGEVGLRTAASFYVWLDACQAYALHRGSKGFLTAPSLYDTFLIWQAYALHRGSKGFLTAPSLLYDTFLIWQVYALHRGSNDFRSTSPMREPALLAFGYDGTLRASLAPRTFTVRRDLVEISHLSLMVSARLTYGLGEAD